MLNPPDTNLQLYNYIKDHSVFESDLKNNYTLQITLPNDSTLMPLFVACNVDFKKTRDMDKGIFTLTYVNTNIISLLSPILINMMNTNDMNVQSSEIVKMYSNVLIRYNDNLNAKVVLYYYYKSRYNLTKSEGEVTSLRLVTYDSEYKIMKALLDYATDIPYEENYNSTFKRSEFNYTGSNIVNILSFFLDDLYKNKLVNVNGQIMQEYLAVLYNRGVYSNVLCGNIQKIDCNAIVPKKKFASSTGYELSIIKEATKSSKSIITYDTGLNIVPPIGYYFELVPSNNLVEHNIKLNNSPIIIDSDSSDSTVKITLTSIDGKSLNVQLPLVCGQLIIKKQIHFILKEN